MAVSERQSQASVLPMAPVRVPLEGDVPVVRIQPLRGWMSLNLKELWPYRELLYFLVWRDVKVRHKQTLIGAAWAVLQPVLTMVLFTLVFQRMANMPSDGLPYPIFVYTALLPWTLFAGALSRSITSLVAQSHLISKVYFPRLIVPLAATISGLVEFGIAFIILFGMMIWYGVLPTWYVLWLPMFTLLTLATAFAVSLWLSALNVRYRDVGHIIPFLVQLWLFASPIAYPISKIPEKWRFVYSLNPMAGAVEGFRWALLGRQMPDLVVISISSFIVVVLLFGGIVYFQRMEQSFADIV